MSPRTACCQQLTFDEFFELGFQEGYSPFLTPESRRWGINLTLRSSILAAVLLVIAFAFSFMPATAALSNMLLVVIYFLAGVPSLIDAVEDLAAFDINIDVLMTLAAFSSVLIGSGMEGALLLVLFALSGSMEDSVTAKAKSAISSLRKIAPTKAYVVQPNGQIIEKSIKDIDIGDKILVKSGQVIPLDGVVVDGISSVNLVHLNGENVPVRKQVGDRVPAGGRNMEGVLVVNVTHTSGDSTLAKIINLVTQAQESRPRLQRWFDSLSRSYAITIICLSALFTVAMPVVLGIPFLGTEGSLYRSLAFLIAASPCALILAIPIAYLSALGSCANNGILLKGGIALDALASCSVIAFDKTGTLTTSELTCESIEGLDPISGQKSEELLRIAYSMEINAVHPIAKSIVAYAQSRELSPVPIRQFESVPGYGLKGVAADGREVYIGHPDYILSRIESRQVERLSKRIEEIREEGALLAVMLIGNEVAIFKFADTVRPFIKETLQPLKNRGIRLLMLTGDHEESARRIAGQVGLDEYYANLKPDDKYRYVTEISSEKGLAMVGDGINDAPALARATVGICMGKVGSTTAVDAADIVLLHDNIEKLDWLVRKARATQRIVKENLFIATAAILVASLPALAGVVPLWLAVVMHEGGTVIVGLNGLRLLRK